MENSSPKRDVAADGSGDCTFCRVTAATFLSGVSLYAFSCARSARGRPFDRVFSALVGGTTLCLGMSLGFWLASDFLSAAYKGFGPRSAD
ncbi:hypothetical protein X943_002167 [Babesia divergens]|uniref:DUF4536 domain-containing protein n=1 Tax=Babesia divergens TaxID=32595 RepID=A0AAD9LF22_BABDI|nr:hypothetical protein X943_002167 [Babesia divergens]